MDIFEPTHPLARRDGYVFEHRKLAWDAGLMVDPTTEVHHRNHNRSDNRLANFEIKSSVSHARDHAEERGYAVNQFGVWALHPPEARVSAPKPERNCRGCGALIPTSLRRDAQYCSSKCQVASWKRRKHERTAS